MSLKLLTMKPKKLLSTKTLPKRASHHRLTSPKRDKLCMPNSKTTTFLESSSSLNPQKTQSVQSHLSKRNKGLLRTNSVRQNVAYSIKRKALTLSMSRNTSNKNFIENINLEEVLGRTYRSVTNSQSFYNKLRLSTGNSESQ